MALKPDFSGYMKEDDESMVAESKKRISSAEANWSARSNYTRPATAATASTASKAPQPTAQKDNRGNNRGGATTTDELVEVLRRATIRLLQTSRETTRHTKLIIEIPIEAAEPRAKLLRAMQRWKDTRPERRTHPYGEFSQVIWFVFAELAREELQTYETVSPEQNHNTKLLGNWFADTFIKDEKHNSVVRNFGPIGRRDQQPEGTWLRLLQFNDTTSQGRMVHGNATNILSLFNFVGGKLRPDRGPVDSLEYRLRNTNLKETKGSN